MKIEDIEFELEGAVICLRDASCHARANSVESLIEKLKVDYAELAKFRAAVVPQERIVNAQGVPFETCPFCFQKDCNGISCGNDEKY